MRKAILRGILLLACLYFAVVLGMWHVTNNARLSIVLPILGIIVGVAVAELGFYVASRISWRIHSSRVSHPPGWGLRHLAEFCFSNKTFNQVLEPALSDMQKEHFDALAAGRRWKARMVLVRGYWSFWSAVLSQLPLSLARRVYEVWKATKTGS